MTLFSGSPLGNSLLDLCMLEEAPSPLSMQSDIEVKGKIDSNLSTQEKPYFVSSHPLPPVEE